MSGPKFSTQISLRNVIQIAFLLFGLGAGWMALNAQSETAMKEVADVKADVANLEDDIALDRERIRRLETNDARTDERVSLILQSLARIEVQLEARQ